MTADRYVIYVESLEWDIFSLHGGSNHCPHLIDGVQWVNLFILYPHDRLIIKGGRKGKGRGREWAGGGLFKKNMIKCEQ